jgi:hypothetical protein
MTWWLCSQTGRILSETEERADALSLLAMNDEADYAYDTERGERLEKRDLVKALSESA